MPHDERHTLIEGTTQHNAALCGEQNAAFFERLRR
jgi:hypothetical protein